MVYWDGIYIYIHRYKDLFLFYWLAYPSNEAKWLDDGLCGPIDSLCGLIDSLCGLIDSLCGLSGSSILLAPRVGRVR